MSMNYNISYRGQDVLPQTYDAVVVGSGATGGWAAKQLAEAGLKVALLEAGRALSPQEFTEHMPAYKLKYRDHSPEIARTRPVQKQCYACMEYNYEWFVNDLENPYSTPPDKPFTWQRLLSRKRSSRGITRRRADPVDPAACDRADDRWCGAGRVIA